MTYEEAIARAVARWATTKIPGREVDVDEVLDLRVSPAMLARLIPGWVNQAVHEMLDGLVGPPDAASGGGS